MEKLPDLSYNVIMVDKEKRHSDIEKLSFEQSLEELEGLVRNLESGDGNLDKSIENYDRGTALKKHCEAKLKEAKLKVDKIVLESGDDLKLEELGVD